MTTKDCSMCVFFDEFVWPLKTKPSDRWLDELADKGRCLRYPPTVIVFPLMPEDARQEGHMVDIEERYPHVSLGDWCGEFKAKGN